MLKWRLFLKLLKPRDTSASGQHGSGLGTGCILLLQETENRTKKEKKETNKQNDGFQGNVYQGIKDSRPQEREEK